LDARPIHSPELSASARPTDSVAPPNIVLFGPPGAGKTAVGVRLAEALGRPFVDTDAQIEAMSGKSIDRIFRDEGEEAFRALERRVTMSLSAGAGSVIAVGGGTLLDPDVRRAVEAGSTVVFLDCEYNDLLARMQLQDHRPLLASDKAEELRSSLAERAAAYASFPMRVDTTGRDLGEVVNSVKRMVENRPRRTWEVNQPPRGYRVSIGPGVWASLSEELAALDIRRPFVVISDSNVAPLYADRVAQMIGASVITFPAGEASKRLPVVEELSAACLENGLDRGGAIIALGGGVTGDIAGLVAAVYMRGVRWVALPTTLLAMIDASLGGKVGVDLTSGKNLIGAFHPPNLALADTDALDTLPTEEMRAGVAELIKAAVIGDELLFEWLEADGARMSLRWLERALAVKIGIVEGDPYERGEREALNLGHTVGHALEQATAYRLRHGDAVAVGLVAEARLAERIGLAEAGLADRIARVLSRVGLPTMINDIPAGGIIQAMSADKKRRAGETRFTLPARVGEVRVGCTVPESVVIEVLRERTA
jgi:shikimate kinase/3-dehydroquinate synthase